MHTAHLLTVSHSIPWMQPLPLPDADPSPVDRMIDACENITLPQTSFAGSKN